MLNYLQDTYGVAVKWKYEGYTHITASCEDNTLLEHFRLQLQLLCSNPGNLLECVPSCDYEVEVANISEMLLKDNLKIMKWLEKEYSLECRLVNRNSQNILEVYKVSSDSVGLEIFKHEINRIMENPRVFQDEIALKMSRKIHIFVDVSNILIGTQTQHNRSRNFITELNISNLVDMVVGLRDATQRVAVGSVHREQSFWQEWEQLGFTTQILKRVNIDGRQCEQAVDDVLHAQMLAAVSNNYPSPRTLVLLSGDGGRNNERTNFPEVIERAMLRGWSVEVWAWAATTSSVYKNFVLNYPSR